jgi:hypothetical protein
MPLENCIFMERPCSGIPEQGLSMSQNVDDERGGGKSVYQFF